jgi:RHS repeat-associated protein
LSDRPYNAFRWYNPDWGRYTQPDPLGISPTIPEGAFRGRLFTDSNLFAYSLSNPLTFVDPLGLLVNLGCMSGAAAEASKCYPMLGRMLDTLKRAKGTFNVTCNPGVTGVNPIPRGPSDARTFTVNIADSGGCRGKGNLVHEMGELWSIMQGFYVHNVLFPTRDDSHAWGTDLEKTFCLRCCCPCPDDIRNKPVVPRPLIQ